MKKVKERRKPEGKEQKQREGTQTNKQRHTKRERVINIIYSYMYVWEDQCTPNYVHKNQQAHVFTQVHS